VRGEDEDDDVRFVFIRSETVSGAGWFWRRAGPLMGWFVGYCDGLLRLVRQVSPSPIFYLFSVSYFSFESDLSFIWNSILFRYLECVLFRNSSKTLLWSYKTLCMCVNTLFLLLSIRVWINHSYGEEFEYHL
jgi:hypothetical protein